MRESALGDLDDDVGQHMPLPELLIDGQAGANEVSKEFTLVFKCKHGNDGPIYFVYEGLPHKLKDMSVRVQVSIGGFCCSAF